MYFSGVTLASLGYGDVVLDGLMRLLGPLQAANGLMMFDAGKCSERRGRSTPCFQQVSTFFSNHDGWRVGVAANH